MVNKGEGDNRNTGRSGAQYVNASGELVDVPVEEFHLLGQHDQSSHGSWATGNGGSGAAEGDYGSWGYANDSEYGGGGGYWNSDSNWSDNEGNSYYPSARDRMQDAMNRVKSDRANNWLTRDEYTQATRDIESRFNHEAEMEYQQQLEYERDRPLTWDESLARGIGTGIGVARAGAQAIKNKVDEITQMGEDIKSVAAYADANGLSAPGREVGKLLIELRKGGYRVTGSENQAKNLLLDAKKIEAQRNPLKKIMLRQELAGTYEKQSDYDKKIAEKASLAEYHKQLDEQFGPGEGGGSSYAAASVPAKETREEYLKRINATKIGGKGVVKTPVGPPAVLTPEERQKLEPIRQLPEMKDRPRSANAQEATKKAIAIQKANPDYQPLEESIGMRQEREHAKLSEEDRLKLLQPTERKTPSYRTPTPLAVKEIEAVRARNTLVIGKPKTATPPPEAKPKSDGVRRVATAAGARFYGLPIGSEIPPGQPDEKDIPKEKGRLSAMYELSFHDMGRNGYYLKDGVLTPIPREEA